MQQSGKTRRLRKYEAPERPCASDPGPPAMDLYSPFGPMIARLRLPDALIARVNAHADRLLAPGEGGELLLAEDVVFGGGEGALARELEGAIRRYVAQVDGSRVERVELEAVWVVSQYEGSPSPVHFHSGDLSGVAYLKTPAADPGEARKTYISGRQAGWINFLIGGKQRFSKSLISFPPQVGDLYLFPGWLLHGAEPFRGTGERRSMAFNAFVTTRD